jgi:hypothetical protein
MRRILLLLLVAFTANADVVLDQEQPLIEPAHGAEARPDVTAGISGRLVEVHVPVASLMIRAARYSECSGT